MSLKLLHEDLMSLICKEHDVLIAYNEMLYIFILLNDVTQKSKIYFLKQKTIESTLQALLFFRNIFVKDKCRVLKFRNDEDSEFKEVFNEYCNKKDITWKFTVLDNSQMNEIFERLNQTLMIKVHSMLVNNDINWKY